MSADKIKTASIKLLSPIFEEVFNNNSYVKFNVTGFSMYPLLRSGIDTVALVKKSEISKYDILLYKREDGSYILHRVVGRKNNKLCMAGDFETTVEFPVAEKQVIATVESFCRNNKYISCRNLYYRLYSFFWVLVLPKRRDIISALKRLQNALPKIRRWKCL